MKSKLTLVVAMATACTALELTAMPTAEEARRAEPAVQKLLEPERAALKSGKKTYSEVAVAAMKLVGEVDTDAEKLLLMKGAFVLYVLDGNFEKSVETMKALKAAIPDIPPQSVTNLIETALLGVAKKEDGARLYKLLDESNVDIASVVVEERNPIVPETATEKTRKAIAKLFPGWSLDSEVPQGDGQPEHSSGFHASHRGRNNIIRLHPMNRETPVVLSRMVKLPDTNPCLALSVASWNDDADFLLSVRVNGKDALTNRLICTSDAVPWEDIVVPLSAWRGSSVKLEIILSANNWWWCEWSHLARVDIIEADGDMSIREGKCEVGGYTWSYRAQNGEATIVAENDGRFSTAVSPCPVGSIKIPATLAGAKVTHIGRDAFRDCSALTTVTIPEGVVRIGRDAFRDCTGLKSIKIPSSVKIIERDAFAGCNALSSVSIPEGVTIIDRGTFVWCCGLESIEIPPSVMRIGRDAFFYCLGLTSVTIPENVVDIGPQAFRRCNALTSVTLPASVTNINDTAFFDTGALTSFQVDPGNRFYKSENGLLLTKDGTMLVRGVNGDAAIPSSVTAIGSCAFEGCVALRSAVIPPGVKSIGNFAFKQCRGMKSVTIPESVTDIGQEAFWGCKNLKSIAIPLGVTVIRNATFSRSGLTEAVIPSNVKVLERDAISWCGELRSVTFPEGMISIGRYAICNCGKLVSLTIPSSVRRIEQGAFQGCGSLTSVTMRGERPDAPNNIFDERCGKLKSIHVPANAKSWAGMKDWQGIPLVFDGAAAANLLPESLSAELEEALVGYWTFDGNANDETRYRNNGTLHDVTPVEDRHGNANKAYRFNGSSYIEVPHSETLNMTHAITMTAWIKPHRWWGYNGWAIIMQKGDKRNCNYQFGMAMRDNRVYLCGNDISSRCGQLGLELNKWQQVALTYESGKSLCLYRDGVQIGTWKFGQDLQPNNGRLLIGYDPFWSSEYFIGDMDDVRLFNRALSEKEIKELYKAEAPSQEGIQQVVDGAAEQQQATVDGYTWSYRVNNGEAMIVAEKDGWFSCAVSPAPTGDFSIPGTLNGVKVTSIGDCAFWWCGGLTSLTFPQGLTTICKNAFRGLNKLTTVTIPASVTNIGGALFAYCGGLTQINVEAGNQKYTSVDGVLYTKNRTELVMCPNGLKEVTIPGSVTNIGLGAFIGCSGLTSVALPSVVKSIGAWAFEGCGGLTSMTIPESVTKIDQCAFLNCGGLTSMTMRGERPDAPNDIFQSCGKLKSIHVPANAKSWAGMKDWQGIPLVFDAK